MLFSSMEPATMNSEMSVLAGFAPEPVWAEEHHLHRRTVANYRAQPNGLPYVLFGGKVYIPIEEAREWLKSRVKRPNPRRNSCRPAKAA